jgi:small nuclear ribonucleoprotein (snRNP)-like protein
MWFGVVLKRRVVVNLKTGTAVSGVLLRKTGPLLIMGDCTVHEPGSEPSSAEGELVIERSNVDFIQALSRG